LKDYHHLQEVLKKIHFVVQGGKCFYEGQVTSQHGKAVHVEHRRVWGSKLCIFIT
jgi:hypothetical protein